MLNYLQILYLVFFVINLIAFILVGLDKKRSKEDNSRVPEVYLFFIAALFASLGVLAGMLFFKHKTQKLYFALGISLLVLQQGLLLIMLVNYFTYGF